MLIGFTVLTLAYETWSGYAIQAGLAMALGAAGMALGWGLLRRGDRLGPRLVTFPTMALRWEPPDRHAPPAARVRVRTVPLGALQAAPPSTSMR